MNFYFFFKNGSSEFRFYLVRPLARLLADCIRLFGSSFGDPLNVYSFFPGFFPFFDYVLLIFM